MLQITAEVCIKYSSVYSLLSDPEPGPRIPNFQCVTSNIALLALPKLTSIDKMANAIAHQQYGKTRVEWLANLNTEYQPPKNFRRTSIICTIGVKHLPNEQPTSAGPALTC